MNDPKMATAPIVRRTNCRAGTHAFMWGSAWSTAETPADTTLRCDCQAYTWAEWQKVMENQQ